MIVFISKGFFRVELIVLRLTVGVPREKIYFCTSFVRLATIFHMYCRLGFTFYRVGAIRFPSC